MQEHRIKETKELMAGHGPNLTFSSAQIYSRASDEVMKNFDKENKVRKESGKHQRRKDADILTVGKILQEIKALKEIPGRTHAGIGTIPKDPISLLNFSDLNAWITKHKRNKSQLYVVSLHSWHQRMNSGTLSEKEIATFRVSLQLKFN